MITSLQNDKIKGFIKLQKSSRYRYEEGAYLVDGVKAVKEVPKDLIIELIVDGSTIDRGLQDELIATNLPITLVSEKVFKGISLEQSPQGLMALVKMQENTLEHILKESKTLIIAVENLQDPGNLGTILRTADSAGADMVLISKGSVDIYNPKVVKATMGSIYRLPIITQLELVDALEQLKGKGFQVVIGDLKGTQFHYQADYTQSTCFVMGNEGQGITPECAACATHLIKIPMLGQAESLNVGVATGILLYEAVRQRQMKK
jgi:RNA methyltransferase, TrmH family